MAEVGGTLKLFIGGYLCFLILVGYFASKKMNNIEDYVLAGRGVGAWVLAFTFSATGMSGWLGMGFAGYAYTAGFEGVWTMVPSATIGILLSFVLISRVIRTYSERVGALTVPDVLEKRYYDEDKKVIRIISALVILLASIVYVDGQLIAIGKTFSSMIGWDYTLTIIFAAIVFIAWTVMGGLLAICWTDFIQGVLMVTGATMAGALALSLAGGWGNMSVALAGVNAIDPDFIISPFASAPVIIFGVSLFLGDGIFSWLGQPTLMVRYMAAKDTKALALSTVVAVFIQSILFGGTLLGALYMRTVYPDPAMLPIPGEIETVLFQFFSTMAHPVFAGIFIGSVLAGIISTADSMLIMGSSTLVNDFYIKIFKPDLDAKTALKYSRIATIFLGALGVLMALKGGSVLLVSWLGWNTLGLFGGPVILGLLWPRATKQGAIAGMVTSFIILVIWSPLNLESTTHLFQAFPAGIAGYGVTWLVSLLTPAPPQEVQDSVRGLMQKQEAA